MGHDPMKWMSLAVLVATPSVASVARAQSGRPASESELPPELVTPDKVDTRLGALEFRDGAPSAATVEKLYDNLDFTRALTVFLDSYRIASTYAVREGLRSIGADPQTVVVFPIMDSQSLFLTANCDTVYAIAMLDLTDGPVVFECPPGALGAVDDLWFEWVTDMGFPGPDRGLGGKYLIVPPDYDEEIPESGYFVAHSRTTWVTAFTRYFLEHDDAKPAVEKIKKGTRIYPYVPGGYGTSIAEMLDGTAALNLAPPPAPPETKFIEATGKAFNTIPASDYRFFEQVNAIVQEQPTTTYDTELAGALAAIGIVQGKPFRPDARMKKILTDAAAVGNATGRALNWRMRDRWAFYPGSAWGNMLFEGGFTFETPPPMVTRDGIQPFPPTGARTLDARTCFFYAYTGISPGMCMRLTGLGSQYLMAFFDAKKEYLDGSKTYRITLPKDIPAKAFWSLTLYDNQTRSMLQTDQRYPRAGSQSYPTPAAVAEANGSMVLYMAPKKPDGVKDGNWIQTVPGKGWFAILRFYSPLQPFFDKTWRPSEIEEAR
ncbi:MAG TPA: DUF1254 domain-containing protein [Planctomycetota bacterium]|nr:DUF1254 domain-containing protein [Planctomycetota bacterium]